MGVDIMVKTKAEAAGVYVAALFIPGYEAKPKEGSKKFKTRPQNNIIGNSNNLNIKMSLIGGGSLFL